MEKVKKMENINMLCRIPTGLSPKDFIAGFSSKALSSLGDISLLPVGKAKVRFVGLVKDKEAKRQLRATLTAVQPTEYKVDKAIAAWQLMAKPVSTSAAWSERKIGNHINTQVTLALSYHDAQLTAFLAENYLAVSKSFSSFTFASEYAIGLIPLFIRPEDFNLIWKQTRGLDTKDLVLEEIEIHTYFQAKVEAQKIVEQKKGLKYLEINMKKVIYG